MQRFCRATRGGNVFYFNIIATRYMNWSRLAHVTFRLMLSMRVAISLPMPRLCRARGSHICRYNIFYIISWISLAQVTPHIFLCRNVSDTNKHLLRVLPLVASMYVLRLVILQTDIRLLTPRSLINVLRLLNSYCSWGQQQVTKLYCRPFVGGTRNGRSANTHAALMFG